MKKRLLVSIRCLDIGGAEKQVLEFVRRVDKSRFEVCLATMYGGVMEDEAKRIDGVRYVNLGKKGRFDIFGFLFVYARLINEFTPDTVFSHIGEMNLFSLWARVFASKRFKLVWTLHSAFVDYRSYGFFFRLLFWLQKMLSRFADKIVCVSRSAYEYHEASGYDMRRAVVVYNGVDTDFFAPDKILGEAFRLKNNILQETFAIGIAARIDRMKGYPLLAQAAKGLLAKHPNLIFVAAGGGDEAIKNECIEILGEYAHRFVWLGFVSDLQGFYNSLNLFCLPSYGEAFGLTVAEAMSCGIPAVVSDAGDMRIIVDDERVVFKSGDANDLGAKLEWAMREAVPNRDRIVQNFDIASSVANTEKELA
ncbi:MAG: glycosyltransferase [Campylobacterales bacterium]